MKRAFLYFFGAIACFSTLTLRAAEPSPQLAMQHRILEVEMDTLVDVYGEVFRDIQKLKTASIHLELEALEVDGKEIEREARQIERGVQLMERRLEEVKREIFGRANRLEEFQEERRRQMEEMDRREREHMGEERRRNMEQRGQMQRERMDEGRRQNMGQRGQMERERMEDFRGREMQERENVEREFGERREQEIRVERRERQSRVEHDNESDNHRESQEIEVKVFVDGREIELEIEDQKE